MKNKALLFRIGFYLLGLLTLALGLTLNTKTGLGVSPIISVAYSVSEIFRLNFGNMTLLLYCLFVIIEMILHMIRERRYARNSGKELEHAGRIDRKLVLLMDFLQIPLSLVFTRFLNMFSGWIPDLYGGGGNPAGEMALRLSVLVLAVILTGIGAAMSLNMRIVPNPGDGIVQALADCLGKSVGFTKNCFDLTLISVTILVSLVLTGHLVGIGIGTVAAVIGVGRTIALFNHLFGRKMSAAAGL